MKLVSELEILAPVQVTFQHGVAATPIRSFSRQSQRTDVGSAATSSSEASITGGKHNHFTSKSAAETQGLAENMVDLTDSAIVKKKKEYQHPWPLGLSSQLLSHYPSSQETLLWKSSEEDDTPRMLVFMFHSNLPLGERPISANRRETYDNLKILENQPKVDNDLLILEEALMQFRNQQFLNLASPAQKVPHCWKICMCYTEMMHSCAAQIHKQALYSCDAMHHERRIMLKQEIRRMVLFFTDQPSLLAPNIQSEVL
ncbi:hypothetical protein OROHE_006362 [Orobanche hederae]